jgi:hypothetical protein
LTLVEVMKSEGGSITFKCSNAESTCVLTISDAEVAFTRPLLQEITANENQIAELECEINRASGKVEWVRNGEVIDENDKRFDVMCEGRRRVLVILKVDLADEAEYICRGVEANANETRCNLMIAGRDIKIRRELIDCEFTVGEEAIFEIEVSHDQVFSKWFIGGRQVQETGNDARDYKIQARGRRHVLIVKKINKALAGLVKVTAGKAQSICKLTVLDGPADFVGGMEDRHAEEMSKAVFTCFVDRANAEVSWYKGRTKLRCCDKSQMVAVGTKRTLIVTGITFEDEKVFSCQADDATVSAKLHVKPRHITIREDLTDLVAVERQPATFCVVLSHENVPELKWFIDGVKVANSRGVCMWAEGKNNFLKIDCPELDRDGQNIACQIDDYRSDCQLTVKPMDVKFI